MAVQQQMIQAGLRTRLYNAFEPTARETGLSFINSVIVALVVLSLIVLALETEPTLHDDWGRWFTLFDHAILAIFAVEYVIRLWIAGEDPRYRGVLGRIRYMFTFYAIADLIAFLPELLWVLLSPAGADPQTVTMLRVLRIARLTKIARFVPAFGVLGAAVQRAGMQLLTSLALALALVYLSAVALFFIEGTIEGQEDAFGSIPRALWWAVATLTTVGYGDVYPITPLGRFAAAIIAIAGIGLVALPAGVFASAFSDELRDRAEAKERRKAIAEEERGEGVSGE